MKLIGKTLMLGFLAAATAVACSSEHQATPGSTQSAGNPAPAAIDGIGAVGMALTLPGGEHISKLTYKLTNGINTYPGSYDVTNTVTPSFVIANVAAGTGYQLTLSATTDDGLSTCSFPSVGTANTQNISVLNRTTTTVNVNMQCVVNAGTDAGNILVNASTSNCPVWNSIVANPVNITLDAGLNVNDSGIPGSSAFFPTSGVAVPANILDGQQLVLVGGATAPNPGGLVFTWTTTGGTLSSPNGQLDPNSTDAGSTNQTIFTCPAAGATTTYTVTLTLSDGADAASCDTKFTTATVPVTCTSLGACGGAPFATSAGGACLLGGVAAGNDPAGFPYITNGTTDPGNPGDFCCSGACGDGAIGSLATTFPSGVGGCTAPATNNGSGCCVSLQPCTTVGQTNCVQCQGNDTAPNANETCTPTEALVVAHDILKGKVTAPGPDGTGSKAAATSCYSCLFNGGCLDDTHFSDTGKECEDALAGGTAAQCQAVMTCVFGSDCASSAVNVCYCGTSNLATTCKGNPAAGPINGSCDTQIAAALGFPLTDGTDNTGHLTDTTLAGGKADQIFQCALSNNCTAVCQN
jgi:hypothetical protein